MMGFLIFYLQKSIEIRELVHLFVYLINTWCVVLIMYGYKVYIMLFKKEKNTKQYFRRKQMEAIELNANTVIPGGLATSSVSL